MLLSVSPADGKLLWKYPWKTSWFVNAAMPIFIPNDKIFISTSYDVGAALLRVKGAAGKLSVEEIWLSKDMKNHFNSSVLHQGYIYGFDNAVLKCVKADTGEETWRKSGFGKGSLILADGHLIVLSERGQLAIVEAIPGEYKEKATAQVLQGKCWTQPTLAGGKLYLRNQKEMICIDLTS
jgi:outer membrane protein assembly factor BamB